MNKDNEIIIELIKNSMNKKTGVLGTRISVEGREKVIKEWKSSLSHYSLFYQLPLKDSVFWMYNAAQESISCPLFCFKELMKKI